MSSNRMSQRAKSLLRGAAGAVALTAIFQGVNTVQQQNYPNAVGERFLGARGYEVQSEGEPSYMFNGCSSFGREYVVADKNGETSEKTVCFLPGFTPHFPEALN